MAHSRHAGECLGESQRVRARESLEGTLSTGKKKAKNYFISFVVFPIRVFSILAKRRRYTSVVPDTTIVKAYYTLLHFLIRT